MTTTNLSRLQGELAELLRAHYPSLEGAGDILTPGVTVDCSCDWHYTGGNSIECVDCWTHHVAALWLPIYNEQELRVLGAVHVDQEANNRNLNDFLDDQRRHYQESPKSALIEEMLRRDRNSIIQGRQLTDGRMANRMLRELTRHLLRAADAADLKQLEAGIRADPKGQTIDRILTMLGAEPADKRLLAESGTTIRAAEDADARAAAFEGLADGRLAHTRDTTTPRPDVADSIRERRARQVPGDANPSPELEEKPDPGTLPGLGD